MKNKIVILLTLTFILLTPYASAATVKWMLSSAYDKVERFSDRYFIISKGGLYGLADISGRVVLEPSYNFITPFVNGYSLVCIGSNQKAKLVKVVSSDGVITDITGNFFVDAGHPYFSEGLLCVKDASDKYGYITPSGKVAIRFRYSKAFPFSEGWAPVRDGRLYRYISQNIETSPESSILVVNFHYGEMTGASMFRDGQAVVAYNNDYALINTGGRVLRKLDKNEGKELGIRYNTARAVPTQEFALSQRFTAGVNDGRYNILDRSRAIIGNVFTAEPVIYSDNIAVVKYGRGFGLLGIIEGDYRAEITAGSGVVKVDTDDNPTAVDYSVTLPDGVSPRDLTLLVDNGSGTFQKVSAQVHGRVISGTVVPVITTDAGECGIRLRADYGDITVMTRNATFPVEYATRITVSAPHLTSAKADEYGYQTVVATVRNESSRPAQVSVTLGGVTFVDGKSNFYIIVPGKGSYTVSARVYVDSHFEAKVTVATSTGARSAATLVFDPYF